MGNWGKNTKLFDSKYTYFYICMAFLPIVALFLYNRGWGINDDVWETAATIRALSVNFFHPTNPILQLPGYTSPRFIPYTQFWGLFVGFTKIGIFPTLLLAGLVNYIIFIYGLYLFISKKFNDVKLCIYVFLTMIIIWGTGYGWANSYQFEVLLESLPHVAFFSFGLSFYAFYFLLHYCSSNQWRHYVIYLLLSALIFISHPITGVFCFITAFAILIENGNFKKLILLQSVPLLSIGISFLWPYFSYMDVFLKGSTEEWYTSPLLSNQVKALGTALVGLPLILYFLINKKQKFIILGFLFTLLLYLFSLISKILTFDRFVIFSVFFLHLAIAVFVKQTNIFNKHILIKSLKSDGVLFVLLFVILIPATIFRFYGMGIHLRRIVDKPFGIHCYESPIQKYLFLSKYLSYDDNVMVNTFDGWIVPAITGAKVVSALHPSPLIVPEENQRKRDIIDFFNNQKTFSERLNILQKYQISYIMINQETDRELNNIFFEGLDRFSTKIVEKNSIVLYRVSEIGTFKNL